MKNEGFTIAEVTIVVAIILVLTTIGLSSSRTSSRGLVLYKNQAIITGLLNRAKTLASERFNIDPTACAFGVHFAVGAPDLVLFQNLEPDGCKNSDGTYKTMSYGNGEALNVISLDPNISLRITSDGAALVTGSPVDVVFIPPELIIGSTEPLPLTFTINDAITGSDLSITINSTGQMSALPL